MDIPAEPLTGAAGVLSGNYRPVLGLGGQFVGLGLVLGPSLGSPADADYCPRLRGLLLVGSFINCRPLRNCQPLALHFWIDDPFAWFDILGAFQVQSSTILPKYKIVTDFDIHLWVKDKMR